MGETQAICQSRPVHSRQQMFPLPIRALMDSTASIFFSPPCWQVSAPTRCQYRLSLWHYEFYLIDWI